MESLETYSADNSEFAPHEQPLPHDEEAERSVIGVLLNSNDVIDELDVPLVAEDFYRKRHELIFQQIIDLRAIGTAADPVTVREALASTDQLVAAGGHEYLLELFSLGEVYANFGEYAQIVRDKAMLRRLRAETGIIQRYVMKPAKLSCAQIIDLAESKVFRISDEYHNRRRDAHRQISEVVVEVDKSISELYEHVSKGGSSVTGLATGFPMLDMHTAGLQPSDLVILAARPSIGKTSLALDIIRSSCLGAASGTPKATALFSLEMSSEQIAKRLISMCGGIDQHKLRSAMLNNSEDWERLSRGVEQVKEMRLWLDDTAILSVSELRGRARRFQRKCEQAGQELSLIVVDYLQLMSGENVREQDNRAVEVSNISRGLKSLAREMRIPVLALSQMSRKIEERVGKRPQLSDLRDSGGIEQDADLIMFLSPKNDQPEPMHGQSVKDVNVELIIGKHRNGPIGSIGFKFERATTTFSEVVDQDSFYASEYEQGSANNSDDSYQFSS